jgi:hypothetical protein
MHLLPQNIWSCELKWNVRIFYLLAMMCASTPWIAASIQGLRVTPMSHPLCLCGSLYHVRKINTLACHFILCSFVSIFSTQHEHNFWKRSLSDTIPWRYDHQICVKCRKSDEMVNRLFSWIFPSTAPTKFSLTTEGQLLHESSCTFLCRSLKCLTHLYSIEWLMACSQYTSQNWRWTPTSHNKLQTTFHMWRASWFSWTL